MNLKYNFVEHREKRTINDLIKILLHNL